MEEFPWGNTRRFYAWAWFAEKTFGSRVQKISLNAGFTCPNRDGSKGTGGCAFCNNQGFNPSYCLPENSISHQLEQGINFIRKRYKGTESFLAYFQAYSNTYAELEHLKFLYEQALSHPEVTGLVVGTRPDCIDEAKLDYLAQLAKEKFISVEYGVESTYNQTLQLVNRGHDFECSRKAIELTASKGLHTGIHMILGLPGETKEMMVAQTKILSSLPINSIKFHQLQIVKGTRFEQIYSESPDYFSIMSFNEYANLVIDIAENLRPDIAIERFSGEVPPNFNAGPRWNEGRSDQVLQKIEKLFKLRNTWQGRLYRE